MVITPCLKRQELEFLADLLLKQPALILFIPRGSSIREVARSAKKRQIYIVVRHNYLEALDLAPSKARQPASCHPCIPLRSLGPLSQRT